MRHKYQSRALVLGRSPFGERNALVTLLTPDIGLVRARAQGIRRTGARLAPALVTFAESDVVLVRGAEGWRITGATISRNWFWELTPEARVRASRVIGLTLRFTPPDVPDVALFSIIRDTFNTFSAHTKEKGEAIECLAVLRVLSSLGLDAGPVPSLEAIAENNSPVITRINRGIELSGL
jgi:DNA repair protein RecO (recombination protein O)